MQTTNENQPKQAILVARSLQLDDDRISEAVKAFAQIVLPAILRPLGRDRGIQIIREAALLAEEALPVLAPAGESISAHQVTFLSGTAEAGAKLLKALGAKL